MLAFAMPIFTPRFIAHTSLLVAAVEGVHALHAHEDDEPHPKHQAPRGPAELPGWRAAMAVTTGTDQSIASGLTVGTGPYVILDGLSPLRRY